jgi:hypothetical protein
MSDRSPVDGTLREITEPLRDARRGMLVSGVIVAGVTAGGVVETVAVPVNLHAGAGTVICFGLLAVLELSVLRTVALMVGSGRPLMDEIGELRRQTGAPVYPAVPWTPSRTWLPPSPADVHRAQAVVLRAAHVRNARVHLALRWAIAAMISFCAWSLTLLITAGRL